MLIISYPIILASAIMSDCDDSFYDSFESGSDSDHTDGMAGSGSSSLHRNVTNFYSPQAHAALFSDRRSSAEVPMPRKDMLMLSERDFCMDHDDWK